MITVVELPEFIRRSKKLLNETERERIVYYLAANPASGVIIEGTGGIRKLRLTVFGKSEKANLSKRDHNELAKFIRILIKSYGVTS